MRFVISIDKRSASIHITRCWTTSPSYRHVYCRVVQSRFIIFQKKSFVTVRVNFAENRYATPRCVFRLMQLSRAVRSNKNLQTSIELQQIPFYVMYNQYFAFYAFESHAFFFLFHSLFLYLSIIRFFSIKAILVHYFCFTR